jgi:hypothetical protein
MGANGTRIPANPGWGSPDEGGGDLVPCDSVCSVGTGFRFQREWPRMKGS